MLHMKYIFGVNNFKKLACLPPYIINSWTSSWSWAKLGNKKFNLGTVDLPCANPIPFTVGLLSAYGGHRLLQAPLRLDCNRDEYFNDLYELFNDASPDKTKEEDEGSWGPDKFGQEMLKFWKQAGWPS